MSQNTPVGYVDTESGSQLATRLNNDGAAMLSSHSGSSRPSYAAAGTIWLDTSGSPWLLKFYDGTDDIVLGAVDTSANEFNPYVGSTLFTGAYDLVSRQTGSGVSSIDITSGIDSSADAWRVGITQLVPASDGANLQLLTDSDAGASFDTTGYEIHVVEQDFGTAGLTNVANGSASAIALATNVGNAAGEGVASAWIDFHNPAGTTIPPFFVGKANFIDAGGVQIVSHFGGVRDATAAIDALRIKMSVGNLSATVALYKARY